MSKEQFSLDDALKTKTEVYSVPDEVQEKVRALIGEANALCREHRIPFLATCATSYDGSNFELRTSSHMPVERMPIEILVMYEMSAKGMEASMDLMVQIISSKLGVGAALEA